MVEQVIEQLSNKQAEALLTHLLEFAFERHSLVQKCAFWLKAVISSKFGHLVRRPEAVEKLKREIQESSSVEAQREKLKRDAKTQRKDSRNKKKSQEKICKKDSESIEAKDSMEAWTNFQWDSSLMRRVQGAIGQLELIVPKEEAEEDKGALSGFGEVNEGFFNSTASTSRSKKAKSKGNGKAKDNLKRKAMELEEYDEMDEEEAALERALDDFEGGALEDEEDEMEEESEEEREDSEEGEMEKRIKKNLDLSEGEDDY